MATHSSILAQKIPWTEETGSPLGHKRIGHNLAVKQQQFITEKPTTKHQQFIIEQHPPPPCCCSVVAQLCLTLCDPMDCSTPGFPVLHHLPELAQTHVH